MSFFGMWLLQPWKSLFLSKSGTYHNPGPIHPSASEFWSCLLSSNGRIERSDDDNLQVGLYETSVELVKSDPSKDVDGDPNTSFK